MHMNISRIRRFLVVAAHGLVLLAPSLTTDAAKAAEPPVGAGEPALNLTTDGKTDCVIVVAKDAIAPEQTAVRELQDHLLKVTDAAFPVRSEDRVSPAAKQIVVGPCERFRKACPDVDIDALAHDGIVIRTVGETLFLAGGRPRGTLYAVYTFLEDVVGCRWWSSRAGESFIPKKPTLSVPPLRIIHVPRLRYREAFYRDAFEGVHAARLKCNGHFARTTPEYGGHYRLIGWCHTFYPLLPPEKYFKDHPEWYSLIGDKRVSQDAQLCLTNQAMRAEFTRNALAWVRADPSAGIISIAQNDCHGACQCPACQAVVKREGAESGLLIEFVNTVAEGIEKEFPGFLVETLAYQYTRSAPKSARPRKNVIVRLCTIECSFSQPLATGTQNKAFRMDIDAWSAIAPQLYIWDYTTVFSNYIQPHPNLRVLAPNVRYFAENKTIGLFEQGDSGCSCSDFPELRAWLLAHLMWDPSRDDRALIDEFLRGYYGPAAGPLREYINLIHDAVERAGTYLGCFLSDTSGWLTLDGMNRATALFDQAAQAVAADPAIAARVRRARMPLDHMWIKRYAELKRTARNTGTPFLGPKDLESFTKGFIRAAHEFDVGAYRESAAFSQYEPSLLAAGRPASAPPECKDLDENDWVDFQESDFSLAGQGTWVQVVDDPKASNKTAARMPANHGQWATQVRVRDDMTGPDRWRCYVVARSDAKAKTGYACQMGLYDEKNRKEVARLVVKIEQAADGAYHAFDLGTHDVKPGMYFWVAPMNNPTEVNAIFVDRVFLVRAR